MKRRAFTMAGLALALTGCGRIVDARATARETAFEAEFPPPGN